MNTTKKIVALKSEVDIANLSAKNVVLLRDVFAFGDVISFELFRQ